MTLTKKSILIIGGIFVCALFSYFSSYFMIAAHAFVDLFAAGRSYAKVFLFFVYIITLFGILTFFLKKR